MNKQRLIIREENWPIKGIFTISRGSKTFVEVVVVEIYQDDHCGRGECVPYHHYGETRSSTVQQIKDLQQVLEGKELTRQRLQILLPQGAARNALDCALWDLEAKKLGTNVWSLAGLPEPQTVTTAYTIGLGTPSEMAKIAFKNRQRPLLKLKLGDHNDMERVRAVRHAAPKTTLIVDANEAWTTEILFQYSQELQNLGVKLVEQPIPSDMDFLLDGQKLGIPICADESLHATCDLSQVALRYDFINIKLDKTGGLTEAIRLAEKAKSSGVGIMVGCMVGTSLGMAPAYLLAGLAKFVDLDGPLLLSEDRNPGICYTGSTMHPPPPELWG